MWFMTPHDLPACLIPFSLFALCLELAVGLLHCPGMAGACDALPPRISAVTKIFCRENPVFGSCFIS
jgi:hypothetical protein